MKYYRKAIMNWQQKKELTSALLECLSMGDHYTRQIMVEQLPSQIKIRVRRSDKGFDDVLNIVSTCSVFPDGLQRLQEVVRDFEGGTDAMIKVDRIFADILSPRLWASGKAGADTSTPKDSTIPPEIFSLEGVLLKERYRVFANKSTDSGAECVAFDKQRGSRVSLQVISLQAAAIVPHFEEAAQRLCQLSHAHLSKVIDYFVIEQGKDRGQYLVTEFVEGETLEELIQRRKIHFSEREALLYITQVCDAVQYLHDQVPPIVHRDITPQHIKIHQGQAVLTNLGAAAVFSQPIQYSSKQTHSDPIVNSGYTPIEQYERTADATTLSDIYALGATLYYLVTNKMPPDSMQRMIGAVSYTQPNKVNREKIKISRSLDEAITLALELEKPKRPQSITIWLQMLQNILYQEEITYLEFCRQLESYLAEKMWQAADQETTKVISEIVKLQRRGQPGNIKEHLPCAALEVINNFWERYSEGRYGFRIQRQIWQEVAEGDTKTFANNDFREFSNQVGWSVNDKWLDYHQFTFTSEGPKGHLPSLVNKGSNEPNSWLAWRNNVKEILIRTEACLLR